MERICQNICWEMCCSAFRNLLIPKFIIILVLEILSTLFYIRRNIQLESSALVCSRGRRLESTDSLKVLQSSPNVFCSPDCVCLVLQDNLYCSKIVSSRHLLYRDKVQSREKERWENGSQREET